jgi:hypothetical protein
LWIGYVKVEVGFGWFWLQSVCGCEGTGAKRKRIGGKIGLGIYQVAESEIELYRMIISTVFGSTYQYFYLLTGLFVVDLREYCEL